jgi:hypothetical protein
MYVGSSIFDHQAIMIFTVLNWSSFRICYNWISPWRGSPPWRTWWLYLPTHPSLMSYRNWLTIVFMLFPSSMIKVRVPFFNSYQKRSVWYSMILTPLSAVSIII